MSNNDNKDYDLAVDINPELYLDKDRKRGKKSDDDDYYIYKAEKPVEEKEPMKTNDGKEYLKAGKKVTLKIKGKTYSGKINGNGVVKFKIKLTKKGKYTAKITFKGDKTYAKAKKSIKVTIK